MRLIRAFLPLLFSASAIVAIAHAEPSTADVESARQLLRQGNELRASNDLRGALGRYKAAHALVGTPITGFEVGRTHVQLGELVEGYEALLAVEKIPVKPKESANTTFARKEADRLAREIESRIPSIRVFVKNVVSRATLVVQLDGKRIEPGVAHKVNPGKHAVVVQDSGSARTREVTVAEGDTRDVEIVLDVAAPPAPPVAPAPQPSPAVATTSGRPAWIWVGFGIAGAGAIAGTVAGIVTFNRTDSLAERCPTGDCPPSEHAYLKATDRWATASTISFAVAGAAAAVSIVGLIATPSHKTETGSIKPTIGLGTIGLEGSF